MKSAIIVLAVAATIGVATEALVIPHTVPSSATTRSSFSALSVMPSSSGGGAQGSSSSSASSWGGTRPKFSVPSKTSRESAVNVEWEPMTELERRIEDGIHYEHIPNQYQHQDRSRKGNDEARSKVGDDAAGTTAAAYQAVFCGYRYTEDDYNRLKSAEVVE